MASRKRNPASGERNAIAGFRGQYNVAATLILRALYDGTLERIRVADLNAGRVDDFLLLSPGRLDAYQVKWSRYADRFRFNDLSNQSDAGAGLIRDLAEGRKRLKALYGDRDVHVHLVTNDIVDSSTETFLPRHAERTESSHFAAFLEESWPTVGQSIRHPVLEYWGDAWNRLRVTSGLNEEEFEEFSSHCHFDYNYADRAPAFMPLVERARFDADCAAIGEQLQAAVADPANIVELQKSDLLRLLGWEHRTSFWNLHDFPIDPRYEPIQETVQGLRDRLAELTGGYVAVVGSPGSGKSSLLTETLRDIDADVISYYAFVPGAIDLGPIRGEAESFLHDVSLACSRIGLSGGGISATPVSTPELSRRLARQLGDARDRYVSTGRKLIILLDGLDHIEREQAPMHSLVEVLPTPSQVPAGVFFVLGTQRVGMLSSAVRTSLEAQGRTLEIASLSRDAVRAAIERASLPVELDEAQHERIVKQANGHPLALVYLLNKLSRVADVSQVDNTLDEERRYEGDIDAMYRQHWDDVCEQDSIVQLLGRLSRWPGPFSTKWFSKWCGQAPIDVLLTRFRHFLRREDVDTWTFFHNSFRLFLQDYSARDAVGEHDSDRDRGFHRDLASACTSATDLEIQSCALRHWYWADELVRVIELADQSVWRRQFTECRPVKEIGDDIRIALDAAARESDCAAMSRCIFAGFELHQRESVVEAVDLAELLLHLGQVAASVRHVRDGRSLLVGESAGLDWASEAFRRGHVAEGRRVFELSEPLKLLRSQAPIENTVGEVESNTLCSWAEAAVFYRSGREVLDQIQRVKMLPRRFLGRDDTQEAATSRLKGAMLLHAGRAAGQCDDLELLNLIDDAFDQEDGWQVRSRLRLLLDSADRYASDGELARSILDEAIAYANRWSLSLSLRLDLAEAVHRHLRDQELIAHVLHEVERPTIDRAVDEVPVGIDSLRFRLARLLSCIEADGYDDACLPNSVQERDLPLLAIARYEWEAGIIWGRAWRGSPMHSAEVANRLRPALLAYRDANSIGSHKQGWYRVTTGEIQFYEMLIGAAAAHGVETLEELVALIEQLWADTRTAGLWSIALQRSVALSLLEVGYQRAWVVEQLLAIEKGNRFRDTAYENLSEGISQSKAWLQVGELDRSRQALRAALGNSLRPHDRKDYQLTSLIEWIGLTNAEDSDGALGRLELGARSCPPMCWINAGAGAKAGAALLKQAWQCSPAAASQLRQWLTQQRVLRFDDAVTTTCLSVNQDEPGSSDELLLMLATLLGWDASETPVEVLEALVQTVATEHPSKLAEILGVLHGVVCTQVASGSRKNWRLAVARGLSKAGVPAGMMYPAVEGVDDEGREKEKIVLNSGATLSGEEMSAALASVESMLTVLADAKWGYSATQLDLSPWLGELSPNDLMRLHSILPENAAASNRLRIAEILVQLGAAGEAITIAKDLLSRLEAGSWFTSYDKGLKIGAMRVWMACDREAAQEWGRERFAREIPERMYWYQYAIASWSELAGLFFDAPSMLDVWPAVENYIRALFPEAYESPEQVITWPQLHSRPILSAAALLRDCCRNPAHELSRAACAFVSRSLLRDWQIAKAAVGMLIEGSTHEQEMAIAILTSVAGLEPARVEDWRASVESLGKSPEMCIRVGAKGLCTLCGWTITAQSADPASLPAAYLLEVRLRPSLVGADLDFMAPHGSVLVDSNDPRVIFKTVADEIEFLSRESGISSSTLVHRAYFLLKEAHAEEEWDSRAERVIVEKNKAAGIPLTYRRPRPQFAWHSLNRVAAELVDGGKIAPDAEGIEAIFSRFDAEAYLLEPTERPQVVRHFEVDQHGFLREDGWVDDVLAAAAASFDFDSDLLVIAESTELQWLTHGHVREIRESGCWITGTGPEPTKHRFADNFWVSMADYRQGKVRGALGSLVVKCWGHEPYGGDGWLAIDPRFAGKMGWSLADHGLFRWIDSEGETMVQSIYWRDGVMQFNRPAGREEVGEGWLVLASRRAARLIQERFGSLRRHVRVVRMVRGGGHETAEAAADVIEEINV